jgi:ABC-type transport system involved in multi-copper enzyme maturation permease subunit
MIRQTIALFRFMMLGILSSRLVVLAGVLLLVGVLCGSFLAELAIINSPAIVAAFLADFLRYSLALLLLLIVVTSVADDFASRQFERLLTMPLARWQYVAAQTMLVCSLCLILVLPVAVLVSMYSDLGTGLYWAAALWLELLLLGQVGLLASLSLEKIPQAFFFTLAIYLLAKLSGLISLMLVESVRLTEGSAASRSIEFIFNAILYVIPDLGAFADSDVFFVDQDLLVTLGSQLATVLVYLLFLLAACLIDFYRKEFDA